MLFVAICIRKGRCGKGMGSAEVAWWSWDGDSAMAVWRDSLMAMPWGRCGGLVVGTVPWA